MPTTAEQSEQEPPKAPAAPPEVNVVRAVVLAWLTFAFMTVLTRAGDVAALQNLDTDDLMRLAEWRDLMAGQGWYDLAQHRLVGPDGGAMHFTRFQDAALSLFHAIISPFAGDKAELATMIAYPPLLFAGAMAAAAYGARLLEGPRAGFVAAFVLLMSLPVHVQFAAGRIDHHGLALTLMLGAIVAALASFDRPKLGAVAGALSALSAAASFEIAPYAILAAPAVAQPWLFGGKGGALRWFGGGVIFAALIAHLAFVGGVSADRMHCDAFETPAAFGFIVIGVIALLLSQVGARVSGFAARFGVAAVAAALAGAALAVAFPACLSGPFAGLDPVVKDVWLQNVKEMANVADIARTAPEFIVAVCVYSAVGAAASVYMWMTSAGSARSRYMVLSLCCVAAFISMLFAIRGATAANALASIPIAALLARASTRVSLKPPRGLARLAALALLATPPFWLIVASAVKVQRESHEGAGAEKIATACSDRRQIEALNALPTSILFNDINLGPSILVHTRHSVTAAPYHRNSKSLRRTIDFFASEPAAALSIVRESGARYLVVCPKESAFELYAERGPKGVAALVRAGDPPPWLHRIELAGAVDLEIYRIAGAD